jgi:hypothetical protein
MFNSWSIKERIVIFGTGGMAKKLTQNLPFNVKVVAYTDNNAATHGGQFMGKNIIAPQSVDALQYDYLVIASQSYKEIEQGLLEANLVPKAKITYFSRYNLKSSVVKENTLKWTFEILSFHLNSLTRFLLNRFFVEKSCLLRPMRWLDTQEQHILKELAPETSFLSYGPKFMNKEQQQADVIMPAVRAYAFSHTLIESSCRLFIQRQQALLERGLSRKCLQGDFCGGSMVLQSTNAIVHRQYPVEKIDKGIVINGVAESNYYHCIIETLSQLYYIKQLPESVADYPLLIAGNLLAIPSVKACLDSLNIDRQIIPIPSGTYFDVKQLVVITTANNNLAVNLKYGYFEPWQNYLRKASLDFIREHSLKLVNSTNIVTNKRSFMARKGPIRSYNQDEVFALLEQYGFQKVYTEEMTFSEQVKLMQQSEYIVGPTGAAWTNLLFANKGTKALCWQAEKLANFACFSNLANAYGLELSYLTYQTKVKSTRDLFYMPYTIELDQMQQWLTCHLGIINPRP